MVTYAECEWFGGWRKIRTGSVDGEGAPAKPVGDGVNKGSVSMPFGRQNV